MLSKYLLWVKSCFTQRDAKRCFCLSGQWTREGDQQLCTAEAYGWEISGGLSVSALRGALEKVELSEGLYRRWHNLKVCFCLKWGAGQLKMKKLWLEQCRAIKSYRGWVGTLFVCVCEIFCYWNRRWHQLNCTFPHELKSSPDPLAQPQNLSLPQKIIPPLHCVLLSHPSGPWGRPTGSGASG